MFLEVWTSQIQACKINKILIKKMDLDKTLISENYGTFAVSTVLNTIARRTVTIEVL